MHLGEGIFFMSDLISHLTDETFNQVIEKQGSVVIVDFWASWCRPCLALAPIFEELAKEYQGKIVFAKVNVDECREVPSRFGIRGIPTMILFQNGQKISELVGNQSKEKIKNVLNSVQQKS